jgi:hypothetical protein
VASVAVVVPFRPGCPYRERAWHWLRGRYVAEGWSVVEASGPPGPWSKGAAVNPAVEASEAEIIVQADADCLTDGLTDAVRAIEDGAPWAIPHDLLHRLSEEDTAAVIEGADWRRLGLEQPSYSGIEGGGVVVARRETLLAAPLDHRFQGWGQEDESHAVALTTIAGEPWRGDADLYHLWHPPQKRLTRRRGSRASWELRRRYFAARNDPAAMTSLIEESRDQSADEHSRDDSAPLRVG